MATITETLTAAQDQVLDAIETIQGPALDAVRTVVGKVEGVLPEDRPNVPFAESLPDAVELVDAVFDFAQKVLDKEHEFAKGLVEALAPLFPATPAKPAKPSVAKTKAAA